MPWYKLPSGMPWYVEGPADIGLAAVLVGDGAVPLPDDQVAATVAAWAERAPSSPLPTGGGLSQLRAAVLGYTAREVSGAFTLDAAGVCALDLTGDTTVTLTGSNGASAVLDVALNGHTLAVAGVTVTADGLVTCVRSRGAWTVRPLTGGNGTPAPGPVAVTPAAPTFTDADGTASDTYTIPTTTGVTYRVGGTDKAAGTYPGSGIITVDAVAQSGYTLTGTTSWSHEFDTSSTPTDGWTRVAGWTFAAADGTALNGLTPSVGSGTLAVPTASNYDNPETGVADVQGGRAHLQAYSVATTYAVDPQPGGLAWEADYTLTTANATSYIGVICLGSQNLGAGFRIEADGSVIAYGSGGANVTYTPAAGTLVPPVTHLRVEFQPGAGQTATGSLYADGDLIGTVAVTGWTWYGQQISHVTQSYHQDSYLDNVVVEGYQP